MHSCLQTSFACNRNRVHVCLDLDSVLFRTHIDRLFRLLPLFSDKNLKKNNEKNMMQRIILLSLE